MDRISALACALTARLDRAADRILQAEHNVSYRRFLALFTIGESSATTQRALAEQLGVTEPSVSRMTGVLVETGLLDAHPDPAGQGAIGDGSPSHPLAREWVARCHDGLEFRLARLVEHSGVPYTDYARHTRQLLAALDAGPDVADRREAVSVTTDTDSGTEGRPA